ncbi:MAG: LLM class F420-dependent oxidoreductase, partial [Armatimonadota bacterium]|nr:LLM class F420-dependent oxidoreductase [Armatimonadota bacterium]
MRLGVVFPQTEIGSDPHVIRDFAQAVEGMGYQHLLVYDHVLGADTANRPGWVGYDKADMFHEPFVLFGFLAAATARLELTTGILILPQRQTALVAKQAAQVDVLSGGRLRLGVGLGWNSVEYEALGMGFQNRGRRIVEQIQVLRALWTHETVTFRGRWHTIVEAGISPLPVQRPIPVWMGGAADIAFKRVARIADGWMYGGGLPNPFTRPRARTPQEMVEVLRREVRAAGRDPATVGIEARVSVASGTPDDWRRAVDDWRRLGATHLSVATMRAGFKTPAAHVDAVRRFL